eukprot:jgi/Psemu1/46010/gm1.46010_g
MRPVAKKTYKAALLTILHPLGKSLMQYGALDSAATDHFLPATYVSGRPASANVGICWVGSANGSTMVSVGTNLLDLPTLPLDARGCHKFQEHGCSVNFNGTGATVTNPEGATVLNGTKDPSRNLYMYPTSKGGPIEPGHEPTECPTSKNGPLGPDQISKVVLGANDTMAMTQSTYEIEPAKQLITYLHAVQTTWYLDKSMYTIKGPPQLSTEGHMIHQHHPRLSCREYIKQPRTNKRPVTARVIAKAHDLPGKFPVELVRGHNCYIYLMICYERLRDQGMVAQLVKLDNEISALLIKQFKKWHLDYQIVPPGDHILNTAE